MKGLMAVVAFGLLLVFTMMATPATAVEITLSGVTEDLSASADLQRSTAQQLQAAPLGMEVIELSALKNLPSQPSQLSDAALSHIEGTGYDFCCGGVCPICFTRPTFPTLRP